jgi:hypothetical protein
MWQRHSASSTARKARQKPWRTDPADASRELPIETAARAMEIFAVTARWMTPK